MDTKAMREQIAAMRNAGELPAFAWPGGYPLYYLTGNGLAICATCANKPNTSDEVIGHDVYWEGEAIACEDCGTDIESAYGVPDNTAS